MGVSCLFFELTTLCLGSKKSLDEDWVQKTFSNISSAYYSNFGIGPIADGDNYTITCTPKQIKDWFEKYPNLFDDGNCKNAILTEGIDVFTQVQNDTFNSL